MAKNSKKTIVLFIQGGAGDVLAHTPMVRAVRTSYPDDFIIVLSTYSQLWENNPNVDLTIKLSDPKPRDFYSRYILDKDVRFIRKRFVYDQLYENGFALGADNLRDFICRSYGITCEDFNLDYFTTEYEDAAAKTFMGQTKNKKVLLHVSGAVPSDGGHQILPCPNCAGNGIDHEGNKCKGCGGSGRIVKSEKTNTLKDLDIGLIEPIVEKYAKEIDFLQIGLEGEPLVPGAVDCLGMEMRETITLIKYTDSFIFIESLFAHAANAFRKSGVVIFQNTDPRFFGYNTSYNLSDSGGCKVHPCNRSIGPLPDMMAGFTNPKTRQPVSWTCPDQVCAKVPTEEIEKHMLKAIEGKKRPKKDGGTNKRIKAIKEVKK